MKNVQKELTAISTALSSLVQQVEKLANSIEADTAATVPEKKAKAPVKKAKPVAKRATPSAKKRPAKKTAPSSAKAKPSPAPQGETMLDNIFGMISRSRKGITVAQLKNRTGLEKRQVSNALYKLSNKGKIEAVSRGVYVKKKR
jgi:predicted Rossmann fold nucleotide-binding protein DprA/Smf involved in DNA uptake